MSDLVKIYRDHTQENVLDFEAIRRYSPAILNAQRHLSQLAVEVPLGISNDCKISVEIEKARITSEGIVYWEGLQVAKSGALIYLGHFGYKHSNNRVPAMAFPVKAEYVVGDSMAVAWFQKSWERLRNHMVEICR